MRANLELAQGNKDAALLDLEEVLKLDGKDAECYVMRGDIYLEMDEKENAKKAYEQAVTLGIPRGELLERLKSCD